MAMHYPTAARQQRQFYPQSGAPCQTAGSWHPTMQQQQEQWRRPHLHPWRSSPQLPQWEVLAGRRQRNSHEQPAQQQLDEDQNLHYAQQSRVSAAASPAPPPELLAVLAGPPLRTGKFAASHEVPNVMQQFGGTEKRIGPVSAKAAPAPTYAAPDHDWFLRRQQQRQRWEQQQIDQQKQYLSMFDQRPQSYAQQQDIPNQYYVPQQHQLPRTHCSAAHAQTTCASFSAPALVGPTINSRCGYGQGGGEIRGLDDVTQMEHVPSSARTFNHEFSVGGLCSLSQPMEVRGHNNDYATGRRSPPPASSSTFIHGVSNKACTKSSPLSSWPQSGPQYEKLEIDVSLDHAPDFDTSAWNRNGVILIPVDTLSTKSEYHDSEIRAIMYNSESGTSFAITGNFCMNANDLKDHLTVLEEEYPRIETYNMFFPLLFKSNKYFLPVFKEAGSETRF
jgi:hypothetical protein